MKKSGLVGALAAFLCAGAVAQVTAPSSRSLPPPPIAVTVQGGTIRVASTTTSVAAGQVTLSWALRTEGYQFNSRSIDFGDNQRYFTCTLASNRLSIRCVKSADAPSTQMAYAVAVEEAGTGLLQQSDPNFWIQNE